MSIWSKLAAIQTALKVPKDQYNDHGNYNYRNGEDILEAVKPLAAAQDTLVLLTDALEQIGTRYYIRATVSLIDIETGDQVSVNAWAREQEERKGYDASQITGASSSYARKYALSALFAIGDSSNDPDATNTHGQAPNKPSAGRRGRGGPCRTGQGPPRGRRPAGPPDRRFGTRPLAGIMKGDHT